ncbi:MAG: hypothetical protein IBJ18_04645 [Phycisphaerales bacterium]|nr:hypothetical protein [Phycisphaerales bacterium]
MHGGNTKPLDEHEIMVPQPQPARQLCRRVVTGVVAAEHPQLRELFFAHRIGVG